MNCIMPLYFEIPLRTKAAIECQNNNGPTNEDDNEGKGDSDEVDLGEDDEPLFPASSSSKRKKSNNAPTPFYAFVKIFESFFIC